MPLVILKHRLRPDEQRGLVVKLCDALPGIVARALDVPERVDARLDKKDVDVEIRDWFHPVDTDNSRISIVVIANEYPERLRNLDERREQIGREVRGLLGRDWEGPGTVWLLLAPGSFGSI